MLDFLGNESLSVLTQAFILSSASTVGFFVAYFVALFLMFIIRWRAAKLQIIRDHEQGKFGWVMVFVEFIDALPEAAMLAQISVDKLPYHSLLAALFVMNFANGFSTTFDIMATIKSRLVYGTMFIVLHFSVGLLSYAISVSVYAHFGDELEHNQRTLYDLYSLYAGTCVGSLFVVCNMAFHHWTEVSFSQANLGETSTTSRVNRPSESSSVVSDNNFENYLSIVSKREEVHADNGERKKFLFKIAQTGVILVLLYIWTVGWTLIIAGIFLFFQSEENHQSLLLVGSFLEGIGGGAFLSTIACTVLVKINECYESMNITDRTHDKWKKILATSARTFFFIAGLIIANVIDVFASD